MILSLIVAVDESNGIGNKNQLPWHLPADLKHFKALTTGHTVIMGRKTYESIGKALPNRKNIVVSRQTDYSAPDIHLYPSLESAISACEDESEVFIIGGSDIFRQALPMAERLYITRIHEKFEADTWFPSFEDGAWQETSRQSNQPDEKNHYVYTFLEYRKTLK